MGASRPSRFWGREHLRKFKFAIEPGFLDIWGMQAPYAVFVDGSEGTTGLEILKYLKERPDLRLLKIDPESRKDLRARAALHNQADISILCLPDAASREILPLITNPETVIIDASTAFRTASGWVFGLPELTSGQRDKIRSAKRISNAGCHATGYLLLVRPLVDAGILPRDARLTATSLTGYSGGGKKMIKQFESDPGEHLAACPYAISMQHKHLPEMQKWSGLDNAPAFLPTVARFYRGMVVTVPIHADQFSDKSLSADAITEVYQRHFAGEPFIKVYPANDAEFASAGLVDPTACAHTQRADIAVSGTGHEHFLLSCRIDNLCKGASGAAVQSLNIVTGSAEGTGLVA